MINKNFAVGLFVAFAIVAFVVGTIWLTGKQSSEPTVGYSMFFERDVSGLMLGGPVYYMGVNVGSVTAMEIIPGDPTDPEHPTRVRIDAEVLESTPVNGGTYAGLALQGITGVAVIKLSAEPGLQGELRVDESSGYAVIAVRDTGISALLARAPQVVDKMDDILVKINQILGQENREFVHSILADISKVSGALAAKEETIGELPARLEETLQEINANLVRIGRLTDDIKPGLTSTVDNLEQTTSNLAGLTKRLETWAAANDSEMNSLMADGLGQIPALVSDARVSLRELEKLIRELREDPSQLMYKPNEEAADVEE